jgi:hypothetical protein
VDESTNRASLVAGIFFILAGTMFLLERLGAFELELRVLAPVLLMAIGVAVLLGGRGRRPSA